MRSFHIASTMLYSVILIGACTERTQGTDSAGNAGDSWIRGSVDERFALVAKHLRGFDVAMAETGYRYRELHWAGQDKNWDYAAYQLDKIETAIANGIERRPKRAASATMLQTPLEAVRDAVKQANAGAFATSFATLTQTCNACHVAEKVPFVQIHPPTVRTSPVGPGAAAPSAVAP